jgi:tetratricopeptide (TPR) repeat protein
MRLLRTCLFALWTVALLAASAMPASASPRGEKLHKRALAAAEEGSFREAKGLWEEAYRLDREPKYLYNLALIAEESDKSLEALTYYERFLTGAPNRKAYRRLRVKARARVKVLLQRVAILEVVAQQPGVEVFVDQRAMGKGPLRLSMRLTQGKHLVVASLAGHHGQTHKLKLLGGQKRKIVIVLSKIRPRVIKQKAQMRYPMPRWLPWTILGTGLAVAVAGIAPLVMQVQAYKDYNDSIDPPLLPKGVLSLKRKADTLYKTGIALVAVGGAVAVGGLLAVLLNRPKLVHKKPKERRGAVETFVGPGSVALRIRF